MLNATLAKLLTAKGIAIGLLACTATGAAGVVAASTGTLPAPIANALGVAKQHVPTPPTVPTPGLSAPALPAGAAVPDAGSLPGAPSAELAKLCDKFTTDETPQGGVGGAAAADLRNKIFAPLVTAAGGSDSTKVTEYCLKLVQHVPSGVPSAPSGVPNGGLPSGLPSGLPGKPTWKPSLPPHPTPSLPINVHPHS